MAPPPKQKQQRYVSLRDVIINKTTHAINSLRNIGQPKVESPDVTKETFWALKDINLEINQGDRVGIIGRNGAGKSTLLKILSRIVEPTTGKISINGRISSLLEVGTGFHPELTGRENVYLNGAILGMRRQEIEKKFDDIVQFSGVEKFLDTPVKHYSSGMYVRLAFSVSAWLDPDVLIVDEVLSVGDQAFQKKCIERMKEITGEGRTVIFVSHSMAAVRSMCDKALLLQKGKKVAFASVDEAFTEYTRSLTEEENVLTWHKSSFIPGDSGITIHSDVAEYVTCLGGEIQSSQGDVEGNLEINKPFSAHLRYRVNKELPYQLVPNFHLYDEFGGRFFISFPETVAPNSIGEHVVICNFDPFLFNVGRFTLMPALSSYEMLAPLHFAMENALRFEVYESLDADPRRHGWGGALPGVTRPRLRWEYKTI